MNVSVTQYDLILDVCSMKAFTQFSAVSKQDIADYPELHVALSESALNNNLKILIEKGYLKYGMKIGSAKSYYVPAAIVKEIKQEYDDAVLATQQGEEIFGKSEGNKSES